MADYGYKVSQPGFDVKVATVQQLVFTSARNTGLTRLTGTTSVTTDPVSAQTITVAHNLGYIPGVHAWADNGTYNYLVPAISDNVFGPGVFFAVGVDSTNVYISVGNDSSGSPHTYTFRYILLVQALQ